MANEKLRGLLFEAEELSTWIAEWQGMPEYDIRDLAPKFQVIVNFSCPGDVEDFGNLIGTPLKASHGRQLQSVWFPEQEIGRIVNKRYIGRDRL
jgi:hypothetical protein